MATSEQTERGLGSRRLAVYRAPRTRRPAQYMWCAAEECIKRPLMLLDSV